MIDSLAHQGEATAEAQEPSRLAERSVATRWSREDLGQSRLLAAHVRAAAIARCETLMLESRALVEESASLLVEHRLLLGAVSSPSAAVTRPQPKDMK